MPSRSSWTAVHSDRPESLTTLSPAHYNRLMGRFARWVLALAIAVLLMAACTESGLKAAPTAIPGSTETESALDDPYDSITGDIAYNMFGAYSAIPAILDPRFVAGEAAREQYGEKEQVLGVSINGDHRAYSIPHLSFHEVVNDVVGGVPVAITCDPSALQASCMLARYRDRR